MQKDIMKTHKHCLPIFIFLITLSGCGNKKKKITPRSSTKATTDIVSVNIPSSDDPKTISDDHLITSMSQFFDADTEEFVTMTHPQNAASVDTLQTTNASEHDQSFKTMYFGFDDHSITKGEQKNIAAYNGDCAKKILAEAQKNGTNATLVIEGHACHSAGSSLYNIAKSEKRAAAAAQQLAEYDIPQEVIKIVGRGSEMPALVDNKPVEGNREEQWPNRRVEMYVVYN